MRQLEERERGRSRDEVVLLGRNGALLLILILPEKIMSLNFLKTFEC